MKDSKKALSSSILSLVLCVVMLIGTTFAWFSDKISSGQNIIQSGNLDIEMYWTDDLESGEWFNVEDDKHNTIFNYDNWEPGYTDVKYIKIVNAGSLALNYELSIDPIGEVGKLAEVINVYYANEGVAIEKREDLTNLNAIGLLDSVLSGGSTANGTLLGKNQQSPLHKSGEIVVTLAMSMITTAGNEYQNKSIGDGFTITALATQAPFEEDSFGKDYDGKAEYPEIIRPSKGTVSVSPVDGKVPTGGVTIAADSVSAIVPEGVALEDGVDSLTLTVTPLEHTTSDVTVVNGEILIPVDVHIEGVSDDNTVPIIIDLGAVLPKYLNMGNYTLIHVEESGNQLMECIAKDEDFTKHNQFKYDSDTGAVTVAMASFSEVALIADMQNAWQGSYDDSWYNATETTFTITNADELYAFAKIVGGMADEINIDDFDGKTVNLIQNIDLNGGKVIVDNKTKIFYPIGYYNNQDGIYDRDDAEVEGMEGVSSNVSSFSGTFNGNGHTITNFYQNTWEMFGDYNNGYSGTPNYYKDAMGLFGYVNGGTVENLTVDHFESDGEFTPTGVIAAYAANATFKNIAITNCNPRVYNTGNGGIVGIGGNSSDTNGLSMNFTNITVDNTNTISALWGSWDVACGGIMGMFRGNSSVNFTNCHAAAQIDVYNDVCGNYQYYWYRYAGMMIGSLRGRNIEKDGYTVPDMTGIVATACTVSFDEWNDYYYCELVDNSIASYTHEHQFSRLEQVYSVDAEKMTYRASADSNETTIPTEGKYNFVTLDGSGGYATENATCYHFVNGKVWNHVDAGFETFDLDGNGELDDYKEDNAHIYLPFNQVFQGDGWGVKHIAIAGNEGSNLKDQGYEDLDIQILNRNSVEKFESKFTGDFLYRVGNENTVSVGSLFAAVQDATINDSGVYVTIDKVDENSNVSGTFKANTTDWTEGTIQFSGTGIVRVKIQDYDFCQPTEIYLEVVDATNLTSATGTTTGGNYVLLSDVNTSDYVYYWNCSLYGNGFTYSLNGAPTNYSSSHGHGVLMTKNATLDNLVIVGDIYDEYGAYTNNNDYNAAIDIMGDTIIQNCYISGCSAPISTRANATITNTTLYGGAVGNLIIKGGTVTLENVTTANYDDDDDRALVGMGVVVHSDASEEAKLVLNGTFTQYNFISEGKVPSDTYAKNLHNAMFDSSCSQYHFGASPNRYVNTGIISLTDKFDNEDITDNANTGYAGQTVSVSGVDGYVYTQPNTSGSVNNSYDKDNDENVAATQGAVPPSYSFDYTTKNYVAKTEGSNDYCYLENGTVKISMDDGDTFNWDTSILTVTKGGQNLDYTVSMNGTDYTGKSIAFNTAGDYEVEYKYTDPNNYSLDESGNIITYSESYTKTVYISVAVIKDTTKNAEFTLGSSNVATEKITINNTTYVSAKGVTADNSTWTYITIDGQNIYYPIVSAKLTSTKGTSTYAYFPVFENVVTITDYADNGTGDAFTYDSSTTTPLSSLTAVKGIYKAASDVPYWYNLTNSDLTQSGASKIFKWASSSDAPSDPTTYNNVLCYKSPEVSADRKAYITLVQYSYTDATNTTYYYYVGYTLETFTKECVTPDTLITLADGSQVRVDSLTGNEQLLVWNMETGKLDSAPIMFVDSELEAEVEVIKLYFSDGTEVKVISEHGFWDYNLNKYVYLDRQAEQYIGHEFAKQNGDQLERVTLVDVVLENEVTTAWSPVTAGHLCYFVNGMLSMPGGVGGLFNIFDVDAETMTYDYEAMARDIETYGLFTYEELLQYADLSREMFDAAGGQYLKVSIGKGNLTVEELVAMIERYGKFF